MTTSTFREAYGVLQRHSETLRTQREPDIDNLLTIVTESVDAYKVCKARIDAVEMALEQALSGADVGGAASGAQAGDAAGNARPDAPPEPRTAPRPPPRVVASPPSVPPGETGEPDFDPADDDVPF